MGINHQIFTFAKFLFLKNNFNKKMANNINKLKFKINLPQMSKNVTKNSQKQSLKAH